MADHDSMVKVIVKVLDFVQSGGPSHPHCSFDLFPTYRWKSRFQLCNADNTSETNRFILARVLASPQVRPLECCCFKLDIQFKGNYGCTRSVHLGQIGGDHSWVILDKTLGGIASVQ